MISKQEVQQLLENNENVHKILEKIENENKQSTKMRKISITFSVLIILLAVIVIAGVVLRWLPKNALQYILIVAAVLCMVWVFTITMAESKGSKKKKVLKIKTPLIRYIMEDKVVFKENAHLSLHRALQSNLFYSDVPITKCEGEDLFIIKHPYIGTKILLSDIVLTGTYSLPEAPEKVYTKEIFRGMFGFAVFPKPFSFEMHINHSKSNMKLVVLESIEFNQYFQVYATDEVMCRTLLTVDFMEDLLQFVKPYKATFKLCMHENIVFFSRSTPLLEPNVQNDSITWETIEPLYNDLAFIENFDKAFVKNNRMF